jgi:hypothetical protein
MQSTQNLHHSQDTADAYRLADLDYFKYVDSPEQAWQEINQLFTS